MSDDEDTSVLIDGKTETKLTPIYKAPNIAHSPPKVDQNVSVFTVRNHCIVLSTTVAILSGFEFGYDLGICSYLVPNVKNVFQLTCQEEHMIGISWIFGALLASVLGGLLVDGFGRKWAIVCSTSLMIIGSVLTAITSSYTMLLIGRLMGGFSGALCTVAQCVYSAEISQEHHRGRLVTIYQLGAALGFLTPTLANVACNIPWQVMVWIPVGPALIQISIVTIFLSESPHFKLLQMSQSFDTKRYSCAVGSSWETVFLALGLVFFQQFTGRFAVLRYAHGLFAVLGVCPETVATVTTITFSFVKVCAICLCVCVIDRLGRRPALILGGTCMMTSLALIGVLCAMEESHALGLLRPGVCDDHTPLPTGDGLHYSSGTGLAPMLPTGAPPPFPLLPTPVPLVAPQNCEEEDIPIPSNLPPSLQYLALFTMLCYEVAYSFSLGPVTWLLLVEIFPAAVRGKSVSMVCTLYWLADLLVGTTLVHVVHAFTLGGAFLMYSVMCLNAIIFVFLFIPETRAKSLHLIAQELKNMSSKNRMFQNLQALPCLSKNEWLQQKSMQYRQVAHSVAESAVI
uniref:(California timema) hypothetical protein n=1 Tax=Timema californicum TaxID=61474 RepID=A0A7R9PCH2_TIMCA|nr:unnamed protein product [Timema californicum]